MQDQTIEDIEPEFGRWVRDQRKQQSVSQGELASRCGDLLDASAISRIESGKRSVRLSEAVAIAQALDSPFLSAQFTERVDPVRRLVSDALAAGQEAQRAEVRFAMMGDDLGRAVTEQANALDRLKALIPEMKTLPVEMQVWVLRTLEEFKISRGPRREVYADVFRAASAEAREALKEDD